MPPNGLYGGMPRVAIVFARLIVDGEDRGIRPFIVALSNGVSMCKGVTSRYVFHFNLTSEELITD